MTMTLFRLTYSLCSFLGLLAVCFLIGCTDVRFSSDEDPAKIGEDNSKKPGGEDSGTKDGEWYCSSRWLDEVVSSDPNTEDLEDESNHSGSTYQVSLQINMNESGTRTYILSEFLSDGNVFIHQLGNLNVIRNLYFEDGNRSLSLEIDQESNNAEPHVHSARISFINLDNESISLGKVGNTKNLSIDELEFYCKYGTEPTDSPGSIGPNPGDFFEEVSSCATGGICGL